MTASSPFRRAVLAAAVLAFLSPPIALADGDGKSLDTVVVTGSRSVRTLRDTLAAFDAKAYGALMDDVGKALTECKKNVKFYWDGKDQLLAGMRSGELTTAMMWDTGGWGLNKTNPDIKFVAPKSGALGWVDTFALPAKGKNDEAAYAWINFNMRPDIAAKTTFLT